MQLAPIILFVYNRLRHTHIAVEALQKNEWANKSQLIIYSDGAQSPSAESSVKEVRQYIHSINGFKDIQIIEQEKNRGLANSIIGGVTDVLKNGNKVIVLEDDIVTSPFFLRFMNQALESYEDNHKVMHISGYMFPIDRSGLPETFFYRSPSCWGWATWKRAWIHFDRNVEKILTSFSKDQIKSFNLDGYNNFWLQIEQNKNKKINTWAIFWYATVFKQGGLCLHPSISMTKNIGHDGSGINCGVTTDYNVKLANNPIKQFENVIAENTEVVLRLKNFYQQKKPGLLKQIAVKCLSVFKPFVK
jgi:hypothetical protein